jgi:septal ring factor EnvC (AmiA/AmiB activator)
MAKTYEIRQLNKMLSFFKQSVFGCLLAVFLLFMCDGAVFAQSSAPVIFKRPNDTVNQNTEKAPEQRLQDIDKALKATQNKRQLLKDKAANLDGDIKRLRDGMVSAAALIQDHEARVDELSKKLKQVTAELAEKTTSLRKRRKQMGGVLQALQRVAQYPPEVLIVQPISPGDTVRTAILLRSTMPELARRARVLSDDLSALAFNQQQAQRHRDELNGANTELQVQRKLLRTLLGRKSRLRRRTVAKTAIVDRKAKALSKEARSLRDLMLRLDKLKKQREAQEKAQKIAKKQGRKPAVVVAEPPADYTGKPIDIAKGKLPFPVVGDVKSLFGQTGTGGLTHKGVTISVMSEAQVIAPYEGRVAFTGPFRGYGRLLIIEHGAGYHTLLAGMGRIDVIVGQWLLGGEPVGIMDRIQTKNKGLKPSLYIELRRGGQPINPLPWLAGHGKQAKK